MSCRLRSHLFSQSLRGLLINADRVAFRAFPQAKTFSFGQNCSKIHEVLIFVTTHARHRFVLDRFPVFCFDEIPARAVVANQTSGLPAGKQELLRNFDRDSWNHLLVMLITKYVKVVAPHSSDPFLVTALPPPTLEGQRNSQKIYVSSVLTLPLGPLTCGLNQNDPLPLSFLSPKGGKT